MARRMKTASASRSTSHDIEISRHEINLRSIPHASQASTAGEVLRSFMYANKPPRQDLWRNRYGRSLNLDVIENALLSADWGNMRLLTDLSRETIDTDPHLASVLNKRFGAISALPYEVVPAEGIGIDREKARFYADVVRAQLKQLSNFGQRVNQLAWGLFDGRAALEIEWLVTPLTPGLPTISHSKFGQVNWMVKDLGWIHPRRMHFGPEREIRIYDDMVAGSFAAYGVALRDYPMKFVYWTPQLFGDYPEREGLARRCLYWSFFKRFAARERMILLELFGKPWRWLEVDEDSTADRKDLEDSDDMLQNIGGSSSFRFPRGTRFQVSQPAKGAGEVHQDAVEESDKQNSKLVLGQTGTTDANPAGLNNIQANVMQDEQFMILMKDAVMESEVFEDKLTDPIIELNFGPQELGHAPHFRLRADVPLDREKELNRLDKAVKAGLEVPLSEAYEISGFRQPKEDEPVIKLETPPLHPLAVQPPNERPVIVWPENAPLPARKLQPISPAGKGGLKGPETRPEGQGGGGLLKPSGEGGAPAAPSTPSASPAAPVGQMSLALEVVPSQTREPSEIMLPFSGFDDFDECVVKMKEQGHDDESAHSICGALKRDYEGATASLGKIHSSDDLVIRAILMRGYTACIDHQCSTVRLANDLPEAVVSARQPEEKVIGSIETLISKGVKEGARAGAKLTEEYGTAVAGLTDAKAINEALQRVHDDVDLHDYSRVIERKMIHGLMAGAIASQYEFEAETILDPAELSAMGAERVFLQTPPAVDPNFVDRPFNEAVKWFRERNIVTRSVFDRLDAAAKRRAFTVAGMDNGLMLERARDELEKQVRKGVDLKNFRKVVSERFESAGFVPANPSHVETVFRTNVLNANNSGRHAQATQPAVLRVRPYWQIRTVNDGPPRQRATHQAVHLWVISASDSIWASIYPPMGFNCMLPDTPMQGQFIGASKAFYAGKAVELMTAEGRRLTITANHPILTSQGLRSACSIRQGDQLVGNLLKSHIGRSAGDDEYQNPARAEDVFNALAQSQRVLRTKPGRDDFHGEAARFHGEIDVVGTYGQLGGYLMVSGDEVGQLDFKPPDSPTPRSGSLSQRLGAIGLPSSGFMSGGDLLVPGRLVHVTPLQLLSLGSTSDFDTSFAQDANDNIAADSVLVRKLFARHSGEVCFDQVVGVREFDFVGHVYDFQTINGLMVASDLYTSNCRCRVVTLSAKDVEDRGLRIRTGGEVSGLPDPGFTAGTAALL